MCGRGVGWGGEGRRNKSLGIVETLPTISLVVVLRNCTKMRNHRSSQQRHSEMFNISFAVKIYYYVIRFNFTSSTHRKCLNKKKKEIEEKKKCPYF